MPRKSYYQDVGNPIQRKLLPSRRLEIALPAPTEGAPGLVLYAILSALGVDAAFLYLAERDIGGGAFVVIASLVLTVAVTTKSILVVAAYVTVPILFAGAGLMAASEANRMLVVVGLAATAYTWLFAKHWTELSTTSPLERSVAKRLRNRWATPLILTSSIPFVASLAACVSGSPRMGTALVLWLAPLPAVVAIVQHRRLPGLKCVYDSIEQWFTYGSEDKRLPGTFRSPVGGQSARWWLFLSYVVISTVLLHGLFEVRFGVIPCIALFLPPFLCLPVLSEASTTRETKVTPAKWSAVVSDLRRSANPIERNSYFFGQMLSDGSPLLIPRTVFGEHGHFLGDSGAGKTARGLAPFIEQTIGFGDASLVVIDLKADSLELLATMASAAAELRRRTGRVIPIKHFTSRDDLASYGFNPLRQNVWNELNPFARTDMFCTATGLEYGTDYGAGYFSAANAGSMHYTLKNFPNVQSFDDLAERCGFVVSDTSNRKELHPEIRKAGVHVHEVLKRLGSFEPLNVCEDKRFVDAVLQQSIELADVFQRPQMLYFHLSTTLGPGTSPAIARLVAYFLLASATKTERNVPVYLVVDEFQRMIAQNVEFMLQLARSMGVGVILANQSMEDLQAGASDLRPAIEANCRFRQWFSVSSLADRQRLIELSGDTVETLRTEGTSSGPKGETASTSVQEKILPRLSMNDISLASDHPKQSIIRLSRGAGYAQYGGLPFIVESDFHISKAEYQRRRRMAWPAAEGTFIANDPRREQLPQTRPGPVVTTEVIGGRVQNDLDDLCDELFQSEPPRKKRRRGRRRKNK